MSIYQQPDPLAQLKKRASGNCEVCVIALAFNQSRFCEEDIQDCIACQAEGRPAKFAQEAGSVIAVLDSQAQMIDGQMKANLPDLKERLKFINVA